MSIIRVENLHHTYQKGNQKPVPALRGVNLEVHAGEYVVILGHNGSGKSTLAKHLNALLLPGAGNVWVKGWNTRDAARTLDIRRTVGMVFQHPDNQIVATIVEEDVAFGPENLGLARDEIRRRVDWSLERVDMAPQRLRAPHLLSGGQKQRVAIAGVLAMQPEVLVLDEATAMLDPLGRSEVLEVARRLNREQGVTIVAVTHFMREATEADRLVIMADGQIALEGPPRELFQQVEELRSLHLDVPVISALARALHERNTSFPRDVLTVPEMVAAVSRQARSALAPSAPGAGAYTSAEAVGVDRSAGFEPGTTAETATPVGSPGPMPGAQAQPGADDAPLLSLQHVAHYYMRDTPLQVQALSDVNIDIYPGEIVGILGHTGSGKSTAIQHFNALLRPAAGRVVVLGEEVGSTRTDVRAMRRQVGLVFQLPEAQLFEQYVGDDIAYGPRRQGLNREEVRARVQRAMQAVGLDFAEFKDRITFSLSGGQMRRVAIAGVLALEPRVLVLDEPTAGLDPEARRQLMEHILDLHRQGTTLVMISHNMEELAAICHRLYVIAEGRTVMAGPPGAIFGQPAQLRTLGLDVPDVTAVADALIQAGVLPPATVVYTLEQAVAAIAPLLGAQQKGAPDSAQDGAE